MHWDRCNLFERDDVYSNQIKSNPLFRHVTPRSTKVLVKTCTCIQIRKLKIKKKNYARNLYITTVKILAINRSTKWLKAESKTKTIYKHYTLSHVNFKRSLKWRNVLWFSDFCNKRILCSGTYRNNRNSLNSKSVISYCFLKEKSPCVGTSYKTKDIFIR